MLMNFRFLALLSVLLMMTLTMTPGFSQTPYDGSLVTPPRATSAPTSDPPGISSLPVTSAAKAGATLWVRADMGVMTKQVFCVTNDKVNFRSGPGTTYAVVKEVTFGNLFPVVSEKNGWYQVGLSGLTDALPRSSPEVIDAAQHQFLSSYKTYTQSVQTLGKGHKQTLAALKAFRTDYAAYKVVVRQSPELQNLRSGKHKAEKVVISKANFTATVYAGGQIVRVFPIAYGSNPDGLNKQKVGDSRTPEGSFNIAGKAVNPQYRVPETGKVIPGGAPNNPFGTRYMALNTWGGSIGLHGTSNPSSIGSRASHGCLRMFTPDAEELFDLIRVGTPITILPVKAG
jgi:lipoprotein-anchoring transpeptidase ErfK/SrfK